MFHIQNFQLYYDQVALESKLWKDDGIFENYWNKSYVKNAKQFVHHTHVYNVSTVFIEIFPFILLSYVSIKCYFLSKRENGDIFLRFHRYSRKDLYVQHYPFFSPIILW